MIKTCSKCKVEKDVSLFSKNRTRKDGLEPYCKDCKRKINSEWHANNKDKLKEYFAKYCINNKDKIKRYKREYRINNKDKVKKSFSKYITNNKDKYNASIAKYRTNNIDNLSDRYIVKLIVQKTSLKKEVVPKSLIEAKRMQILINRTVKEMTK